MGSFQNVAVGCINRVARLMKFFSNQMYEHFAGAKKKTCCNNEVTKRQGYTVSYFFIVMQAQ